MPKILAPWTVTYTNAIETRFNNMVQTTGELMEILDSTENIEKDARRASENLFK